MKAPACTLEAEGAGTADCIFRLKGVLDFDSVPPLHERAVYLFPSNRRVTVDLAGVERSNSAGLALLLEWQRLALRDERELRVRNLPAALLNIARVCELERLLPQEISRNPWDP